MSASDLERQNKSPAGAGPGVNPLNASLARGPKLEKITAAPTKPKAKRSRCRRSKR